MSTKSFLKNINIKNPSQAKQLINALENAESFKGKEVVMTRFVTELRGDQAKDFIKHYAEQSI